MKIRSVAVSVSYTPQTPTTTGTSPQPSGPNNEVSAASRISFPLFPILVSVCLLSGMVGKRSSGSLAILVAAFLLFVSPLTTSAATVSWTSSTGKWSNPLVWSTSTVPTGTC